MENSVVHMENSMVHMENSVDHMENLRYSAVDPQDSTQFVTHFG